MVLLEPEIPIKKATISMKISGVASAPPVPRTPFLPTRETKFPFVPFEQVERALARKRNENGRELYADDETLSRVVALAGLSGRSRLRALQRRHFSKKEICPEKKRDKPCDNNGRPEKPKKIVCYCVTGVGKLKRGPCEKRCEDEDPSCRYCKRYRVYEDPKPKRE